MIRMYVVLIALVVSLCSSTISYELVGVMLGESTGDQYGRAFCNLDFNDDGYQDLVVSAPAADYAGTSSGRIYIYFGGQEADTVADLTIDGPASSFFGKALASAGDFNGDGVEDLLVGAPFYDVPATSAGAAYLYYGGPSPDVGVDVIFGGEAESDYFGIAVAGGGDFNNDGWGDIAVGAYKADWGSFSNSGKLYVYYGGPGADATVDQLLVGEADGERFGYAVTMGDFTGDDVDDIAVGAYSLDDTDVNQGRIYVFEGGATPDAVPDHTITGVNGGDKFGWSLACGLINNDAYTDIVMGTDGYVISTFSAGRVYVFDGGPTLDDVPLYTYDLGNAANDYLGFAVTAGVDINSDGNQDFMAGMPGYGSGGVSAGGAILFAGGTTIAADTTILGESASESLGQAVFFWPDFGSDGSVGIGFGGGATGYDDFRGRVKLFKTAGSVQPNQPPVLNPIGNKVAIVGVSLMFGVISSDPDGAPLELTTSVLPTNADFVDHGDGTGTFEWTTDIGQIGSYPITFDVFDGEFHDSEEIFITVTESCCVDRVGDANNSGDDEPTIGDVAQLVNHLFIDKPPLVCVAESDINQSGGLNPSQEQPGSDITIGDIAVLTDYLFITGPTLGLEDCL